MSFAQPDSELALDSGAPHPLCQGAPAWTTTASPHQEELVKTVRLPHYLIPARNVSVSCTYRILSHHHAPFTPLTSDAAYRWCHNACWQDKHSGTLQDQWHCLSKSVIIRSYSSLFFVSWKFPFTLAIYPARPVSREVNVFSTAHLIAGKYAPFWLHFKISVC